MSEKEVNVMKEQEETEAKETVSRNFIEQIIDKDLSEGVYDTVHTRFPPEPNGYLHIGHAKSILLNYGLAKEYGGKFNMRFDDTNPTKEKTEFVESILADIKWLGADWEDRLFFASNYFEQMYEAAVKLIKNKPSPFMTSVAAPSISRSCPSKTASSASSRQQVIPSWAAKISITALSNTSSWTSPANMASIYAKNPWQCSALKSLPKKPNAISVPPLKSK